MLIVLERMFGCCHISGLAEKPGKQTEELSSQSVPKSVVTSPNTKAHGHAEEHAE